MSGHPFLKPVNQHFGEWLSDADPAQHGAIEMGDYSIRYVSPGSIPDQLGIRSDLHVPMPTGRSEGTEANSNSRQFGSFGASNQPSASNKFGV